MTKQTKRVSRVLKTRNAGTMTEAAFWGFIRSSLRRASIYWKPILKCKQAAKRPYQGPNKRQKFEYQCNICKLWYPDKNVSIDHIKPAGILRSAQDLPTFVENLFIEENGLQALCKNCHDLKSKTDKLNMNK